VLEAEAFRIVEEVGDAFFLDFLARCQKTARVVLVLRVRVQRETLEAVRDRLDTDVLKFTSQMVH